ncbi:hypothetical protein GCM10010331_10920 [Streptomyces xanthochromogenes]|uniref:hypothetical protein n=1 Tax=Streptomyces TaxID=1883 RepID=UPI001421735D|nr:MULTISPECIES: hypothetical protein [Streptomyces]GHB26498.1 hypothetical protein GCM10010331_10920 [Streptomyces xanthochromogenes]
MSGGARSRVVRFAEREWGPLFKTVKYALYTQRWRAIWLTLSAVALTSVFQAVQNQSWGFRPIQIIGSVKAEYPLWISLLRTPFSLFVPALDLPVWGALAQVLLVFGIAEICIGRGRMLLIAYVATLAGTLYARVGIRIGPDSVFGLPASAADMVDTGPSAAVVALAVYVCWRYRAYWTAGVVAGSMVVEVVLKNNLAGKEHIAALIAVAVICWITWVRRKRRRDRHDQGRRTGSLSGAPPIQS